MQKIENAIDEYQHANPQKRLEIEDAQQSVEHYQQQLEEVRNNREYDTLTKEIEFQSLEIELCNKKVKEATVKVAERKADADKTRGIIAERQKDLEHKRGELEDIMQETKEEEEALKTQAEELETKIEPRLLNSFKRIRKGAHNGLGIVYVQRDACGGCFNKIPPQRQLDIKMHKKVIVCEYCGRILIDPELAGIKVEAPVEKKSARRRSVRTKKTVESSDEEA